MRNPKELTRIEVLRAAASFRWTRKLPKWTVIVENRELPARPLVLEAAGVPPNDPTNSHQAVAILKNLGFETRYAPQRAEASFREEQNQAQQSLSKAVPEAELSIVEILSDVLKESPPSDWDRVPTDLAKNLDHYLYGSRKSSK